MPLGFPCARTPGRGFPVPSRSQIRWARSANLDNNTGESTRETVPEDSATNIVQAVGVYDGPLADPDGSTVTEAIATETVTIEDVRMRKTLAPRRVRAVRGGRAEALPDHHRHQ